MATVINKRSVMTLYSDKLNPYSHRVRRVLAEKGVTVDILDVNPDHKPEDLLDLNPYNTVPTLVDRDLVLYDANIIMEYLDERFPHPPLLPVYPIARAKMRLLMFRIEQDWYSLVHKIENADNENTLKAARKALSTGLIGVARLFGEMPYFLSEEFTLVDCCLAPLLWRLPYLGIELPAAQSKAIYAYARRIFTRDSFIASLTEAERELPQ